MDAKCNISFTGQRIVTQNCVVFFLSGKMLTRRNWLLRFSIILNVAVICYVGTHFLTYSSGVDFVEDIQTPGRNLASIEYNTDTSSGQNVIVQPDGKIVVQRSDGTNVDPNPVYIVDKTSEAVRDGPVDFQTSYGSNKTSEPQGLVEELSRDSDLESVVMSIPLKTFAPKVVNSPSTTQSVLNTSTVFAETSASSRSTSEASEKTLEEVIKCHDRDQSHKTAQRGDFWVLYNYVTSSRTFKCYESVTYTTHADYTFLDNLEPLLERWQGPVSLALHAPGTDFNPTLETIQYLRECGSSLVAQLVTFHIYFGTKHVPKQVPKPEDALKQHANCSNPPPWANVTSGQLYKSQKKLLYPVNIGRNIARESAITHYILPSDIELYPSPGVIGDFLELIRRQEEPLLHKNPKVFPLSIFELEADAVIPSNKTQLVC